MLLDGVRRSFQLVNHDLRESVVLWIVGKQRCDYTCALVPTFCNLLCFCNYISYFSCTSSLCFISLKMATWLAEIFSSLFLRAFCSTIVDTK